MILVVDHGAELVEIENPAAKAHALLHDDDGIAVIQLDRDCNEQKQRRKQNQRQQRHAKIEGAFDDAIMRWQPGHGHGPNDILVITVCRSRS